MATRHRLWRACSAYAVENGAVAATWQRFAGPRSRSSEIEILSAEQIAEVRTKLAGHALVPIVELALATGMRRGELLGLQWGDVDLDRHAPRRAVRRGDQSRPSAEAAKDAAQST